ncbi:hypothetical protein JI721_12265 [Alicyclobacillus cycloheptanicus]|uniref:Copper amine oxidase N-terminal domain-containing protein n=1 Tax=Alicyclobacillus cycloheptanicus TaxID=1457 RepID=A0ABT9XF00_9BACL|nr:hypothetical protein [Alicyclobacillus cycloheptanicus]MDQ0188871.1 hypothetical protein [Alicyclobacillus cycloheptanicus]WDM00487.1 hypothetical protein JI721_12265 [Alicyclobacillus cycloheptanicus]
MKKAAGYIGAFLAGSIVTGGMAIAATTYVQAQKGTSIVEMNGQKVASPPTLVYGGTTYVQLYSIQQALKKVGWLAKWDGSKTPGVLSIVPAGNIAPSQSDAG